LVAGTVRVPVLVVATALVAALAIPADINRPWHGPLAVAVALLASIVVMWHCVRRFGGVTGDVLGACVEVAAAIAFVAMAL
jgi:adenosylcobinamide-GDP ribazoletransferase